MIRARLRGDVARALLQRANIGRGARKKTRRQGPSRLEEAFAVQVLAAALPPPVREHKFHPGRGWRFDFAWPTSLVAVEVEGGIYSRGRHVRPAGYMADCEKYNEARLLGWTVLRVAGPHIKKGTALRWLERALGERTPHE